MILKISMIDFLCFQEFIDMACSKSLWVGFKKDSAYNVSKKMHNTCGISISNVTGQKYKHIFRLELTFVRVVNHLEI